MTVQRSLKNLYSTRVGTNIKAVSRIYCKLTGRTTAFIVGTCGTIFEAKRYSIKVQSYSTRVEVIQLLKGMRNEVFYCCSSLGIFVNEG